MTMTEPAIADTEQFDFFLRVEVNDETAFFLDDSPPPSSAARLRTRSATRTAGQIKSPIPSFPQKTRQVINGIRVSIAVTRNKESGNVEIKAEARRGDQIVEVKYTSVGGENFGSDEVEIPPSINHVLLTFLNPQDRNESYAKGGIAIQHECASTSDPANEKEMDYAKRVRLTDKYYQLYSTEQIRWAVLVPGMIGAKEGLMEKVKEDIEFAMMTDVPVLVLGETGVGKEVVVDALHIGRKRSGKFIKINCSELVDGNSMITQSKLFGIGKGHGLPNVPPEGQTGLLMDANEGTVLLDEIGDLPLATQINLLRIMDGYEFYPAVGKGGPFRTTAHFVGATNLDLDHKVKSGEFRPELLERLKTLSIEVPPLRQRLYDLLTLLAYFTEKYGTVRFAEDFFKALLWYHWPGNVRELERLCRTLLAKSIEAKSTQEKPIKVPLGLESLDRLPLNKGLRESIRQAYENYKTAVGDSDIGGNEIQIINKLTEISAAMFPSAFEALAAKNETTINWEQEIIKGQQSFKDFLLQIHPNKADALQKATNCFAMLTACYPDQASLPKKILRQVYESLKECIDLSSDLETPRYQTFEQFFGRKYDAVRKWE